MNHLAKTTVSLILIILFAYGCGSDVNTNTETSANKKDLSEQNVDFPLVNVSGQFKYEKWSKGALFDVDLTIKNNTSNKINSVSIISGIEANFQIDNKITYYPDPDNNYNSEGEFLRGVTTSQFGGINNVWQLKKNSHEPDHWLPGEEKTFHLKVFNDYSVVWEIEGFNTTAFERTPSNVDFIYKYEFKGIDGEYTDIVKVDILSAWKNYQRNLGLR